MQKGTVFSLYAAIRFAPIGQDAHLSDCHLLLRLEKGVRIEEQKNPRDVTIR